MISSTVKELHQGQAEPDWWDGAFETTAPAGSAVVVDDYAPMKVFVGAAGLLVVSGDESSVRFWKARRMSAERRTYDEDVRAQVSALWAEDWDCDEDAVYDRDW